MNKRQAKRLLNVARALRESPAPHLFDMGAFVNDAEWLSYKSGRVEFDPALENFCGTPACALGHYGSRPDLQHIVKIVKERGLDRDGHAVYDLRFLNNQHVNYDDGTKLPEHFGLNYKQMSELFDSDGCGGAKTTVEAAKYIENFVKRVYGSLPV